jgi:LAS superfamily LD-carboxypeptidase LdcB
MRVPPAARDWRPPHRLVGLALLPLLWLVFTLAVSTPTGSYAQEPTLHFPRSFCQPGAFTTTVALHWTPVPGAIEQWIDLTTIDGGFTAGEYMTAGPLPGNSHAWEWRGIQTGKVHHWRVNSLTDDGWVESDIGAFVPCGAPSLLMPVVECDGPTARVTLRWAPSSGPGGPVNDQWLEFSIVNDGFASLLSERIGPLDGYAISMEWEALTANVEYFYRVTTETIWGWTPTQTGRLFPVCEHTTLLPCGDIMAPLNKQHRLPLDCEPPGLVLLPPWTSVGGPQYLRQEAAGALVAMLSEAAASGYVIAAASTYRSYADQEFTYGFWVNQLGQAAADRISARPGHSEHQLGTAADLTAASVGFQLSEAFGRTAEGQWLAENAPRFGFVVSYPADREDITGYAFEPWHLRYVGAEAANAVQSTGLTLHEYLLLRWYGDPSP